MTWRKSKSAPKNKSLCRFLLEVLPNGELYADIDIQPNGNKQAADLLAKMAVGLTSAQLLQHIATMNPQVGEEIAQIMAPMIISLKKLNQPVIKPSELWK